MIMPPKVTPFLWYNSDALEAARFYTSLFPQSEIVHVQEQDGKPFIVSFDLHGVRFTALNGGPHFKHTEAFSISIRCEDQAEVDHLWSALTADGGEEVQCGWLKDRFGLSWQIVPRQFYELMTAGTPTQSRHVMDAMMKMVKFDVTALQAAFASGED